MASFRRRPEARKTRSAVRRPWGAGSNAFAGSSRGSAPVDANARHEAKAALAPLETARGGRTASGRAERARISHRAGRPRVDVPRTRRCVGGAAAPPSAAAVAATRDVLAQSRVARREESDDRCAASSRQTAGVRGTAPTLPRTGIRRPLTTALLLLHGESHAAGVAGSGVNRQRRRPRQDPLPAGKSTSAATDDFSDLRGERDLALVTDTSASSPQRPLAARCCFSRHETAGVRSVRVRA